MVDTEGEVLERVSRIRQWWELVMTIKKTIVFLLAFGAVSVAGNINNANYWKEGAIQLGLMSAETYTNEPVYDEVIVEHTQGPPGPPGIDGKQGKQGKQGPKGEPGAVTTIELNAAVQEFIKSEIERQNPPNHRNLH